jgi:hypothetical protein
MIILVSLSPVMRGLFSFQKKAAHARREHYRSSWLSIKALSLGI